MSESQQFDEKDRIVCPWCTATGTDPCRTTDGQRRVHHKARARMERAVRRMVTPPALPVFPTPVCDHTSEAPPHLHIPPASGGAR